MTLNFLPDFSLTALPFLWGTRLHPVQRPQLGFNAQPQTNRYGYMNLFEAFAYLKRVLKQSCLKASPLTTFEFPDLSRSTGKDVQ